MKESVTWSFKVIGISSGSDNFMNFSPKRGISILEGTLRYSYGIQAIEIDTRYVFNKNVT